MGECPGRLVTWAVRREDLEASVAALRTTGHDIHEPYAMSRLRPDGVSLEWRLAVPSERSGDGVVPFLINWGETELPAFSLPFESRRRVELRALELSHPDPLAVRERLATLDVDLPVAQSEIPRLGAVLDTPRGNFLLR